MSAPATALTRDARIDVPLICGPMYPCSNPELVAAASEAGGIGVLQPVTLTYVFGYDFREGIRKIRSLTDKPIGMNALIEASSKKYFERMSEWLDIALEEGVRFFITSLGKPKWVVERVEQAGGVVYHDVTERKWALKAVDSGVHGLIGVNRRAGGHAGPQGIEELLDDVGDLGLPVVCAGGIGAPDEFVRAISLGYAGVQMGTRFIATHECQASAPYKQAIVDADEDDIVLTERLTGIGVAVINTPYVERLGLEAGPITRRLLRHPRTKHLMRSILWAKTGWTIKRTAFDESATKEYWQAGRSVARIDSIVSAGSVVNECAAALRAATPEAEVT